MNIAIIPARGGSKRIPRKNIKSFNGKPIITYSIEAALQCGCFDKVVVSTDDQEIASIAKKYGAEVPFIRPEELSNDFTATIPVIKHAIDWFNEKGTYPKYVCCIYATAPFITPLDLKESNELLLENQSDYCFSVTNFPFPIQRAIKKTKENRIEMFHPEHFNSRSQDLEEAFHDAGQFYWGKAKAFSQELPIFSKHAVPYELPSYRVQDIDTQDDWIRAEFMYQAVNKMKKVKQC